jgi:undecaprenyl diphosphate synthase
MPARYVAIIMDGNARWARERRLPALEGHRVGAQTLKQTVRDAVELGISELTVYAFSTENWTRPKDEVDGLMIMFAELIESETPELDAERVRMRFIGRRERVPDELVQRMSWAEQKTRDNERMTLFIAFNYGGRAEIVEVSRGRRGRLRQAPLRPRHDRARPPDTHQR